MKKPRKAPSRIISARVPATFAAAIEAAAAVRHVSASTFIAETLHGRNRPSFPMLAAFQALLGAIQRLEQDPSNASLVGELGRYLDALRLEVRAELGR
jgi:hypothetical protein